MKHQELTCTREVTRVSCRLQLGESGEVGAQRGEHLALRWKPRFEFAPRTEGPSQPFSTGARCFPQLAR
jgi:hypothetical protein